MSQEKFQIRLIHAQNLLRIENGAWCRRMEGSARMDKGEQITSISVCANHLYKESSLSSSVEVGQGKFYNYLLTYNKKSGEKEMKYTLEPSLGSDFDFNKDANKTEITEVENNIENYEAIYREAIYDMTQYTDTYRTALLNHFIKKAKSLSVFVKEKLDSRFISSIHQDSASKSTITLDDTASNSQNDDSTEEIICEIGATTNITDAHA